MEIKITVNVGGNDPIEVKVDVPVSEKTEVKSEVREPKLETSIDAKWFDESCTGWTKNFETNKCFLLHQQEYCNIKLKERGYLFLNEVYDCLGMVRTRRGQVIGWVYDPYNPVGDNYVDFGIYDDRNHKFINGNDNRALLDFNVDGDILNYL